MASIDKIIKGVEYHRKKIQTTNFASCLECPYLEPTPSREWCLSELMDDIYTLLKEQEARELTIDEWREWKENPKRNPICELWENDTSPMWVLNPDRIHEPALLMGKLKLFTGKPTFDQCKAVKWNE